jgi:hypothetical protein
MLAYLMGLVCVFSKNLYLQKLFFKPRTRPTYLLCKNVRRQSSEAWKRNQPAVTAVTTVTTGKNIVTGKKRRHFRLYFVFRFKTEKCDIRTDFYRLPTFCPSICRFVSHFDFFCDQLFFTNSPLLFVNILLSMFVINWTDKTVTNIEIRDHRKSP